MNFDESRPDRVKRAMKFSGQKRAAQLQSSPVPPALPCVYFDQNELNHGGNRVLAFDVESYPNYFCVGFKCVETRKVLMLEDGPYGYTINGYQVTPEVWAAQLSFVMHRFIVVGFNSRYYDIPMVTVAIQGVRAPMLNQIGTEIISENMPGFEIERKYIDKTLDINHVDLIEVCPLSASLKTYAARLHAKRLQDLPYLPFTHLTEQQTWVVRDYNLNDLDDTILLWLDLQPQITLRVQLGLTYGMDLRSKSDAQIAETVIVSELRKLGVNSKPAEWLAGQEFYYQVPDFINFKTPQFQHALDVVRQTAWVIGTGGYAECPKEISALKPTLGLGTYRLGAGGLHSSEESVGYEADEDTLLIDRDVASYYPYIILNLGLYPPNLGEPFLKVYQDIVNRRIAAKREGNKVEADSLKITINGTFGKLGNKYSKIYSPDLLIQVTMTGQLSLLMLIEMVELAGIPVVSANTDGIVMRCPKSRYADLEAVIITWEEITGFLTEETRYRGLYSRDVNNYIAVKEDGECKTKGVFSEVGSALNSPLSKNPEAYICSYAVQEYLAKEVPLEHTIESCRDFTKFLCARNVQGGGEQAGVYLGKVVRWYYAKNYKGTINYVTSGNKVPKTEGAKPCMILPDAFPEDLDHDWYINEATAMLYAVGKFQKASTGQLF